MPPILPLRLNALRPLLRKAVGASETSYQLRPRITVLASVPVQSRPLTSTRALQKKKEDKAAGGKKKGGSGGGGKSSGSADQESSSSLSADDPYGLEKLELDISKALDRLKQDLEKLRTGGRFNPDILENVRVRLVKDSKETFRLGDLAQVIPKGGRSYMLLASDADHVKPILSAIQSSNDLNLQPQPDPQNPLQLIVPIPPPTKESRDQALQAATAAGQKAKEVIGSKRAGTNKNLRAIELAKTARPDDIKKAQKQMEKIVEKGAADAVKMAEDSKKNMQQ
ncbi:ribosomal recycling factor [Phlyctema vagabunda]|uniref:Ribosomal recycling factor n=1 Tax=Phlyctema vagabunda TaxID=108571 RepID=A0ABR4PFP5_9HELO